MPAMRIFCPPSVLAPFALALQFTVPPAQAQVRITEVTVSTRNVELKNFGSASVNLATWQWCTRRSYSTVGGTIAAGATRQFTVNFNQTSSDLCLYKSSLFGSTSDMEDFVQWGASFAGNTGREDVAKNKGVWTAGFFFALPSAGKSLHAKAQPPATGLRMTNWFTGWPHAGFPVPDMAFESIGIAGGQWHFIAKSYYLTSAHHVEVRSDLSSPWLPAAAPVITELGSGRIDVTFPATEARQFSRLRVD